MLIVLSKSVFVPITAGEYGDGEGLPGGILGDFADIGENAVDFFADSSTDPPENLQNIEGDIEDLFDNSRTRAPSG